MALLVIVAASANFTTGCFLLQLLGQLVSGGGGGGGYGGGGYGGGGYPPGGGYVPQSPMIGGQGVNTGAPGSLTPGNQGVPPGYVPIPGQPGRFFNPGTNQVIIIGNNNQVTVVQGPGGQVPGRGPALIPVSPRPAQTPAAPSDPPATSSNPLGALGTILAPAANVIRGTANTLVGAVSPAVGAVSSGFRAGWDSLSSLWRTSAGTAANPGTGDKITTTDTSDPVDPYADPNARLAPQNPYTPRTGTDYWPDEKI